MSPAREIFDYLYIRSAGLARCDVVIGFGHFDMRIPRVCGALFQRGLAGRVILTGGVGSGTADLGEPEAHAFLKELRRACPEIPGDAVFVEGESTNTSENILFTSRGLAGAWPDFNFASGIRSAILVASPYRQRRVLLTCRKLIPQVACQCAPPETTFEEEVRIFAEKGQDFDALLGGEIDRIIRYGEEGYIERETVPPGIARARGLLAQDD